jgi:diamine N-acetyltransferase
MIFLPSYDTPIELHPITPDNHGPARKLAVHPHQEHLIATVDKSLADAYVYRDAVFRIAYEEDVPVGFVLVFPFDRDGKRIVNIARLMIDAGHQGRGLGRALLETTLAWVDSFDPRPDVFRISTLPENEGALALYRSAGFEERGTEEGEIALYMERE